MDAKSLVPPHPLLIFSFLRFFPGLLQLAVPLDLGQGLSQRLQQGCFFQAIVKQACASDTQRTSLGESVLVQPTRKICNCKYVLGHVKLTPPALS